MNYLQYIQKYYNFNFFERLTQYYLMLYSTTQITIFLSRVFKFDHFWDPSCFVHSVLITFKRWNGKALNLYGIGRFPLTDIFRISKMLNVSNHQKVFLAKKAENQKVILAKKAENQKFISGGKSKSQFWLQIQWQWQRK